MLEKGMRGSASVKRVVFLALLTGVSAAVLAHGQASGALISNYSERQVALSQIKLAAYDAAWSYLLGVDESNSEEVGQLTKQTSHPREY
ncbi:MAG: hypothetical protein E5V28_02690 [Mesorhizobium sp.]|uniref:hypothetical protein n=1 Tax=Mesorhizobium sp. TaxID=1871066 RepID=UPI00121F45C4|nr:hypothetical protein [Mesorhizobium sp.]TIX60251.1 MAG: hypothetical protein E5V28_02690 [Mesorhizobium sp.]